MNRFFLPDKFIQENKIFFPPDISHQILNVLRLHEGSQVQVLDNQGYVYDVALSQDEENGKPIGRILAQTREDSEPSLKISLYFGMTSREKVEWILQKGTEVGVSAFHPFISTRSLVQSVDLTPQKIARWERIIREAAEQSHRGLLPELCLPLPLKDCLTQGAGDHDICLIAWEEASVTNSILNQALVDQSKAINSAALMVGPEGGFTPDEIMLAKSCGCRVVSLGKRILRMETAAIIFPALVLHEIQNRKD